MPKAQDAELWLKCEIPLDTISASKSFNTTIDQCRLVRTMTIPINGKQNIHLLKWRPCVFHVKQSIKLQFPILRLRRSIIFDFTHIHRCVSALYTQYLPEFCEKKSQAYYSGGIQTHDRCNSRAVSYQLDHRDCTVYEKLTSHFDHKNTFSLNEFFVNKYSTSYVMLFYQGNSGNILQIQKELEADKYFGK